ncbi:hypothetical protein [Lentzea sp. NBRC 102530]|uniref:TetR family transcriptional regulator C-terminal domain-containing protein n=1 Tax=Lentzea sp. NBRC 102530 TaxID=3032201 RepID=UPI0024A38987|nr:hypothetical protein [Lentzea sp. NBRC 102530]GLY50221.1 hypothetical protein Lesp01_38770 [Lentzea sp. NBRC 102530]
MVEAWSGGQGQLRAEHDAAVDNDELPQPFDVGQALFEILAAGFALNSAVQLGHDPAAAVHARRAMERALTQT